MGKVDKEKDKKVVQDYIYHMENRVKTGQDVANVRFSGVIALHAMLKKVSESSSSSESKAFWIENLKVFNDTLDFVALMHTENNEINSYNEYNYELNQKLSEKLKVAEEQVDKLTKILEEKYK